MNEKHLLKIALGFSILGILLLFFISQNIEINDTTIRKITEEGKENTVSITGTITKIERFSSFTKITLSKTEEISVLAFENIELSPGIQVKITGKSSEGSIIANKIETLT